MVAEERYGKPFNMILAVSPQTERGRNLRDLQDLAPVVAEALFLLAGSPLGEIAFATTDNFARRLESVTADGQPNCWGSFALVGMQYRGLDVANHFAHGIGSIVLKRWLSGEPDETQLREHLAATATGNRLGDVDAFMTALYRRDDGRLRIADFADEVTKALRKRKVKAREIPPLTKSYTETFSARLNVALEEARTVAQASTASFLVAVTTMMHVTIDNDGPCGGASVTEAAITHVDHLRSALNDQREALREQLAEAEQRLEPAAKELEAAAARSRTGFVWGIQASFKKYLTAASTVFALRYGYSLADIALVAFSGLREALADLKAQATRLEQAMLLAAETCRNRVDEFDGRRPSKVQEIIDRPLYRGSELRELYRWATGGVWGEVTDTTALSLHSAIGGLSHWLDKGSDQVLSEFMAACVPVLSSVRTMNADDFVRWLRDARLRDPAIVLRDARSLAPVLARFDRTRYSQEEGDEEATVVMLGVPSAETSVFAGTPHVNLVSTGDAERIVFLVLKLGYPASSLWHYPHYQEANDKVRSQAHIAHLIYPGFRDEPEQASSRSRMSRKKRKETTS